MRNNYEIEKARLRPKTSILAIFPLCFTPCRKKICHRNLFGHTECWTVAVHTASNEFNNKIFNRSINILTSSTVQPDAIRLSIKLLKLIKQHVRNYFDHLWDTPVCCPVRLLLPKNIKKDNIFIEIGIKLASTDKSLYCYLHYAITLMQYYFFTYFLILPFLHI